MVNQKYNILQPLLLSIFLAFGMLIGYRAHNYDEKLIEKYKVKTVEDATRFDQVARLIENNYLFDTDIPSMTDEVFRSMASGLDPFSVYIPPANYIETLENLDAKYIGLGITTHFYHDTLTIIDVIEDSPAQRSGLKVLDRLTRFNNNLITKSNSGDLMNEIRRSKGKELELDIIGKNHQLRKIRIKIDQIEAETIDKTVMLNDTTLYVSISQFSNHTYRELLKHIEENVKKEKLGKLILDVRNNPGGYLQEVLKILDQFFQTSDLKFVETLYKDGRRDINKSTGRNFYTIDNIIVLINSQSASGSEVLAGVIQDLDRGVIIGKNSFGKGLVQDQFTLYNGGALRLTIAEYFLPSGRNIQKRLELKKSENGFNTFVDQDTFFSINLHRPLRSGSGIEPDIVINDTLFDDVNEIFFQKSDSITDILINMVLTKPELKQNIENLDKFTDFIGRDSLYASFINKFDEDSKGIATEILRAKVIGMLGFKNEEHRLWSLIDPYISTALATDKKAIESVENPK